MRPNLKGRLPVPRTWLSRPVPKERTKSRDAVLAGRLPEPGTKRHLRSMLVSLGWPLETVDIVLGGQWLARDRLMDMALEARAKTLEDVDITQAVERLTKAGFAVEALPRAPKTTTAWLAELWDSYTRWPWWAATGGGQRTLVFTGSVASTTRATASFVHDLWLNLGGMPAHRMPVVKRFALLSWMSTDALRSFKEDVGPEVDVAVFYGGKLENATSVVETFGYVAALAGSFDGLLLFEAVPSADADLSPRQLLSAAARSDAFVFGLSGGALG